MTGTFANRHEAGKLLARHLELEIGNQEVTLIALPRGGVSVAYEVAEKLSRPLHTLIVRKLGAPDQPDLAIGAIASGGFIYLNHDLIERLGLNPDQISRIKRRAEIELERRENLYRQRQPKAQINDARILLIDDGIATGASVEVAVRAIRAQHPKSMWVAVPVAAQDAVERLHRVVDQVFALRIESQLGSISQFYEEFPQVTDDQVVEYLTRTNNREEEAIYDHKK